MASRATPSCQPSPRKVVQFIFARLLTPSHRCIHFRRGGQDQGGADDTVSGRFSDQGATQAAPSSISAAPPAARLSCSSKIMGRMASVR